MVDSCELKAGINLPNLLPKMSLNTQNIKNICVKNDQVETSEKCITFF